MEAIIQVSNSTLHSFILSFRSFIRSFIGYFYYSLILSLICSFIPSLCAIVINPVFTKFILKPIPLFLHSFIRSFIQFTYVALVFSKAQPIKRQETEQRSIHLSMRRLYHSSISTSFPSFLPVVVSPSITMTDASIPFPGFPHPLFSSLLTPLFFPFTINHRGFPTCSSLQALNFSTLDSYSFANFR